MGRVISLATGKPISSGKALVVTAEGQRFSLRMAPAINEYERRIVNFYDRRKEAMAADDYLSSMFPALYRSVVDQTPAAEAQ